MNQETPEAAAKELLEKAAEDFINMITGKFLKRNFPLEYENYKKCVIFGAKWQASKPEQPIDASKNRVQLSNIVNQEGIDLTWLKIWENFENWYGDPEKKETGREMLLRIQKEFSSKPEQGEGWVKASECLPEKCGAENSVIIRSVNCKQKFATNAFKTYSEPPSLYFELGSKSFVTIDGEGDGNSTFDVNLIEWYKESPSSHLGAKEGEKESKQLK